jgi:hypothetical protein
MFSYYILTSIEIVLVSVSLFWNLELYLLYVIALVHPE